MAELLAAKGIVKRFGDTIAVNEVDISARSGEIVALLGPNGAGKTTTIDCILGLRKRDSGSLRFFGVDRDEIDIADKQRIGVQLQNTVFFPELKVIEILRLFSSLYKKCLALDTLLDSFSLREQRDKQVKTLSGGQKQRLALACALVNDPELLFLDEPTAGIDTQNRLVLWGLIERLRANGKGIILTTHYMEEAERLADRVVLVDHGQIVAKGSVEELKRSYGKESLEALFLELTGSALRD